MNRLSYFLMCAIISPTNSDILGVDEPVAEFVGRVIAIIHRLDDVEDKWVVAPEDLSFTKEEIIVQVAFQEQFFKTEILV